MATSPPRSDTTLRHHLDLVRLLEHAAAEFARHGIDGVSMSTLAERCGVTKAALYYHFPSKEALYEEVCNQKLEEIAAAIATKVSQVDGRYERLEAFVGTLFDLWVADKTLLLISLRDAIRPLVDPGLSSASRHFTYFMGKFSQILGAEEQHMHAIAFPLASLLYGYCSLMGHDSLEQDVDGDTYRQRRKTELIGLVRRLWKSFDARGAIISQ